MNELVLYDTTLQALQEKRARKRQLEAQLEELTRQRTALNHRLTELEARWKKERSDVERLERPSLSGFFYALLGQKEERLEQEQREAYAAQVKHQSAQRELGELEELIHRRQTEWEGLSSCEIDYEALWRKKADAVRATGSPAAQRLLELEATLAQQNSQLRELDEAIAAGQAALEQADQVLKSLEKAADLSGWDLMGGGLLVDLAKYDHLDEAQRASEVLQGQLDRFQSELADVAVQVELQLQVDDLLRFADFFLDGFLADWAVMDQITASQKQVRSLRAEICQLLTRLEGFRSQTARSQESCRQSLDELVRSTPLRGA